MDSSSPIIKNQSGSGHKLKFPNLKHHPLRASLEMLKSSATLMTKLKMKRAAVKNMLRVVREASFK